MMLILGGHVRRLLVVVYLLGAVSPALAQTTGPYVSGFGSFSTGDGGGAPAGGGSVGWMSARHLGFEVEVAAAWDLDFADDGPRIATDVFLPSIFPLPTFESRGRLLTYQTNAVVSTGWRDRWNVSLIGGGGVASLRRDTRIGYPVISFPELFGPPLPSELAVTIVTRDFTTTESALSLNLGGQVEYALTRRLGVAVEGRYLHAFLSAEPLDTGRVAGRIVWRF
jgi:hypothetical protein